MISTDFALVRIYFSHLGCFLFYWLSTLWHFVFFPFFCRFCPLVALVDLTLCMCRFQCSLCWNFRCNRCIFLFFSCFSVDVDIKIFCFFNATVHLIMSVFSFIVAYIRLARLSGILVQLCVGWHEKKEIMSRASTFKTYEVLCLFLLLICLKTDVFVAVVHSELEVRMYIINECLKSPYEDVHSTVI